MKTISLVVPVYNEESAIPIFYRQVRKSLPPPGLKSELKFEIVFVNDGSSDNTENIISNLANRDPLVLHLSFTRNFGKEAALCAGLDHATGDAVIPMDVDLQDPIEVVELLIEKWLEGADVVLAKRVDRSSDTYLKRKTAELFYELHNKISSPKIEANVGDFRLLDRSVVENLKLLSERNLFMKGILSWVGGSNVQVVEYTRKKRVAGDSKFNTWKLWNFALEGITSFSTLPLRIWTYIGSLLAFFSGCLGVYFLFRTLFFGSDVPGYPSIITTILFLGGVQLIGIGVLGEYIGRIYMETKQRPRYILKSSPSKRAS